MQDAIVSYLADPPLYEVRNLAAWLTVVAANRARDRRRRAGAELRALMRFGLEQYIVAPDPLSADPMGADPLSADVLRALRVLPRRQREICVLHYLLDRPLVEIADALGVSTGTVKTHLHRARGSLAARLTTRAPIPRASVDLSPEFRA